MERILPETDGYKQDEGRVKIKKKWETLEGEISTKELQEVMSKLKNGNAPGCDKITTKMIKNTRQKGVKELQNIRSRVWKKECIPNN